MKKCILFITGLVAAFTLSAQNPQKDIEATINGLFASMQNKDTTALRMLFHPDAGLQSVSIKNGVTVISNDSMEEFIAGIGSVPADLKIEERLLSMEIRTDGLLSTAWTPYEFYVNDTLSHCGVNAFHLVFAEGKWLISHITDTRRKECSK